VFARKIKWVVIVSLALLLMPIYSASAATGANASGVTSNALWVNWTLEPGETSASVYKDGVYQANVAGSSYYVSGLSPCTTYNFNVVGSGSFGSSPTSVKTAGCPTAPVITYTTTYSSVSFSWTSSNAVSYDIYKDGNFVTTTSGTSYYLSAKPSTSHQLKVIAKNATGQTAESIVYVSTPSVSDSWTFAPTYHNLYMTATFTNTNTSYSSPIFVTLYRVTSSGDVSVVMNTYTVGAGQTISGKYLMASSQPYGTYKISVSSPYVIASGVSLTNY